MALINKQAQTLGKRGGRPKKEKPVSIKSFSLLNRQAFDNTKVKTAKHA